MKLADAAPFNEFTIECQWKTWNERQDYNHRRPHCGEQHLPFFPVWTKSMNIFVNLKHNKKNSTEEGNKKNVKNKYQIS